MRALTLALVLAAGASAVAEEATAPPRYQVQPGPDGFVRIDTQTGAVSHCGQRGGVWYCEPFAEETGLASRIGKIETRVDALARQVEALSAAVAANTPPPEAPGFTERLVNRLFLLVKAMKTAGG